MLLVSLLLCGSLALGLSPLASLVGGVVAGDSSGTLYVERVGSVTGQHTFKNFEPAGEYYT